MIKAPMRQKVGMKKGKNNAGQDLSSQGLAIWIATNTYMKPEQGNKRSRQLCLEKVKLYVRYNKKRNRITNTRQASKKCNERADEVHQRTTTKSESMSKRINELLTSEQKIKRITQEVAKIKNVEDWIR